ncbi:phage tail protein [Psychromonas sp. 14N.309.X.WAT.B.A12]|uniref:phage tail protein n=1 Tax=Psychromonas sp. 14N.309.X.WAT.B.A12 TaxID=2998322 RepID=UPI0025AF91AC|nr:phage tail protein [Psychromonas sp. 14N.309.X.WAT.B.A12]MDN2661848.1 phage tail protein [Psychromonas sp. 14N.309.X.WAT.B.A12]
MFEDDLKRAQLQLKAIPSFVDKVQAKAINSATRKALTLAVNGIKSQVNLKSPYIRSKLKVYHQATAQNPVGVLGVESRGVLLDRFDGQQIVTKSKNPSRSKGDPLRGISAGYKSQGTTVKIKPNSGNTFFKGFYIPLKNNNSMGIAVRTGSGQKDYKVLYGPSVSQTFKTVREDIAEETKDLVVTELLNTLESIS